MQKKVSIIVPAYNAEKTIRQCLDSLVVQDYTNTEIIVVNDGSKDGTAQVLNEYAAKFDNVIAVHKENGGVSSSRNKGIDIAFEDNDDGYIAFIDSDDWVEPYFISTLVSLYESDKNCCLSACGYKWQSRNNKHFKNKKQNIVKLDKLSTFNEIYLDRYLFMTVWNKLFDKKHIANLRFDEHYKYSEDLVFMTEYIHRLSDKAVTVCTQQKCYHYVRTKGSLSLLGGY